MGKWMDSQMSNMGSLGNIIRIPIRRIIHLWKRTDRWLDHSEQGIKREIEPHERAKIDRLREYFKQEILGIIADSRLFDEDFYISNYKEEMEHGEDAWQHFLSRGLDLGFLPSKTFDPVLYKILKSKESDSVDQLLERYSNNEDKKRSKFGRAYFQKIIPHFLEMKINLSLLHDSGLPIPPLDYKKNVEHATQFAEKGEITFSHADNTYRLIIPEPKFFLNKIAENKPFAFARLPHGFWDYLLLMKDVAKYIGSRVMPGLLNDAELESIATRLLNERFPKTGVFGENFLHEVFNAIGTHKGKKNFFAAVDFKGIPTWDNRLFRGNNKNPRSSGRIQLFAKQFNPGDEVYDATLWKRWVISGALKVFPELCRNRPVFLVGPEGLGELGRRWKLSKFTHIKIPHSKTFAQRHSVLNRICNSIEDSIQGTLSDKSTPAPIVLFQCGGSLAFWLMSKLFDNYPSIFFIDMGQALNGWFLDQEIHRNMEWALIYGLPIIKNMDLEDYYINNLSGDKYNLIVKELQEAYSKMR